MEQLRMIHKMKQIPDFSLEEGFTLRAFRSGEEPLWLEMCKAELLEGKAGKEEWDLCITAFPTLLPERDIFFVCDKEDHPVATTTAFTMENAEGLLHMVAVDPQARGHKLGWSMTAYGIHKLVEEGQVKLIRLKTDDWRKAAVLIYLRAGFQPVLFDVDMDKRWKALCDELNFHGVEMLDLEGNPTGVIL